MVVSQTLTTSFRVHIQLLSPKMCQIGKQKRTFRLLLVRQSRSCKILFVRRRCCRIIRLIRRSRSIKASSKSKTSLQSSQKTRPWKERPILPFQLKIQTTLWCKVSASLWTFRRKEIHRWKYLSFLKSFSTWLTLLGSQRWITYSMNTGITTF